MFGGFTMGAFKLGGIKGDVMDIGVLRTTIMETGNGLTAICITAELY
jgi:small-conductance mechanosensitive channel